MKVKTYNDLILTTIRATGSPAHLVMAAMQLTQKKDIDWGLRAKPITLEYLLSANHSSLLEHCSMTFHIENVSRSFLAQITRHRMASYTASSQHYQDYRDYPVVISPGTKNSGIIGDCTRAVFSYKNLIDNEGIPHDEARQVLPNASAVNILWTINARSLVNFLNLRLCKRNTAEMHHFAEVLLERCRGWWYDLFKWVGADCEMKGECTQGKMSCGEPYDTIK